MLLWLRRTRETFPAPQPPLSLCLDSSTLGTLLVLDLFLPLVLDSCRAQLKRSSNYSSVLSMLTKHQVQTFVSMCQHADKASSSNLCQHADKASGSNLCQHAD